MKTNVYTIKDIIMNNFCMPFFAMHHDHAKRICKDLVTRGEGTTIFDHPEDHDLYHLGEFDDVSGLISPHPMPEFIIHLSDYSIPSEVKNG